MPTARAASTTRLATIMADSSRDAILMVRPDGRIIEANATAVSTYGYSRDELLTLTIADLREPETHEAIPAQIAAARTQIGTLFETVHRRKAGTTFPVEVSAKGFVDGDDEIVVSVVRDLSERRRGDEERATLARLVDHSPASIVIHRLDGTMLYANRKTLEMHGYSREEFMRLNLHELDVPESEALIQARVAEVQERGEATFEAAHYRKDRTIIPLQVSVRTVQEHGDVAIESIAVDLSEHRRAEAEREKLRAQLFQSQKMESVGRLAGGVAHDFNNMLSVILGHTEMALEQVDAASPLHADLREIRKAAERSANLTRQLLAFARKQTVAPRVLDLNGVVAGMLTMLGRMIGEDIELVWHPGADLPPVNLDPSQIDQVLANLCVNSRDAIRGVGTVTIATDHVVVDAPLAAHHADSFPGDYVRLTVGDTGCGIDPETRSHLFEPFFTTKAVGEGTGLGLATVYGIVKQNAGFINVNSEVGHGTTVEIYLPCHWGTSTAVTTDGLRAPSERGNETVLLVEDELAILGMTKRILESLGYRVLAASTPGEAIRLAEEHHGEIRLLVSDVVMPEMNGRDLASRLLSIYPGMKRLFMSGYTADVIAHHGVLEEGMPFIQKPWAKADLAAKIREVLGQA